MPQSVSKTVASMRVLLVSDSYPPLVGGATRDTALLAEQLAERGHEVRVLTVAQPDTAPTEWINGVLVHRVAGATTALSRDQFRVHHPPVVDPVTVRSARTVTAGFEPDVVHSYGWLTYSALSAVGRRVPVVLSIRDYSNICAVRTMVHNTRNGEEPCSGPGWSRCLQCAQKYYRAPIRSGVTVSAVLLGRRKLAARVDAVHYCSRYVQEGVSHHLLQDMPERGRPVERVIGGFHTPPTGPGDAKVLAQLPSVPYILFVGALRRVKGVEDLLDAYGRLRDAPPLVLIGPRTPDTPAAVLAHSHVLPSSSYDTVAAAWQGAIFGVAPSRLAEPFGNVVHEAMSWGRPVIGTAPSGMTDMIEPGVNGLLVPPGNPAALADAMSRLLDDEPLRRRLADEAVVSAARFTPERIVPEFESLYRAAISHSDARRAGPSNGRVPDPV